MNLSIVLPIYRKAEKLERFLKEIVKQKYKDFELVIIVDTNKDKVLNIIDQYSDKIKNLRLVFNTKQRGRSTAIKNGVRIASGSHLVLLHTSAVFKDTTTKELNDLIKANKNVDIIEFKVPSKTPIKLKGTLRKKYPTPIIIAEKPEVLAYTNPFPSSKIFSKEVALKSINLNSSQVGSLNSRYSINSNYLPFFVADKYVTSNIVPYTINGKLSNNFNPPKMIRQWKALQSIVLEDDKVKFNQEIVYAYYFSLSVYITALTQASKNKLTTRKVLAEHKRLVEEEKVFEVNKYLMSSTVESKLLRENKNSNKQNGLHKKF